MNVRRIALIAVTVLASILVSEPWTHGATTATPTGQRLFQFVNSGTGPLPWNAMSLTSSLNGTTMLGAPHGASGSSGGVIAYRTNGNHLATYAVGAATPPVTTTTSSPSTTTTVASQTPSSWTPAADPIPFYDPSGFLDLLYVDV